MPKLDALRDIEEPTIRERPIGVLVFGMVSFMVGGAILLAALELLGGAAQYGDWTRPKVVGNDYVGAVQVYPEHYLVVGTILLIPAIVLLALPYGIARQRWWAGILAWMIGGLFAAYGLLALVIPGDVASQSERWHPAAGVPWLVLGVVLLWYFNRRPIRRDLGMGDRMF